jgi:uncharacterized protein YdeI (YjbR/CyaY-like superfamily)
VKREKDHADDAKRFRNRDAWRAWLEKNAASSTGVWLLFAKKGSGVPSVRYDEAVEEALCFGWIDSIVHKVDETFYRQRFTPRKPGSNWAASNRERFARMVREGRMTPAGLAHTPPAEDEVAKSPAAMQTREVPDFVDAALRVDAEAWAFYQTLAPGYRREYGVWIADAKREETRRKRIDEAIALLRRGKKLSDKWGVNR